MLVKVGTVNGVERNIELFRQPPASSSECRDQKKSHQKVWPSIGFARLVSRHSALPECLGLARIWLKNCLEQHSECSRLEATALPARVLYVGGASEEPRLLITNGTRGTYVALSHCWGGDVPTRLTTKTESLWKTGIPFQALPQTFRDAVTITRALGINHLWIDCLCILQDSQNDWAAESSRMADTYTNAVVTIAADQSTDCHGGILAERPVEEVDLLPIHLSSTCHCTSCTVFARRQRDRNYPFISHSAGHARLLRGGLHARGWTLQERLLPRRVLHFTPSELAWECAKEVSCECRLTGTVPGQYLIFRRAFVNGMNLIHPTTPSTEPSAMSAEVSTQCLSSTRDKPSTTSPSAELLRQIHGPLYTEAGGDPSGIVQLHWNLVVFEFTARTLTFATDRLAALAGIADLLCRRTGQEYYFGVLSAHAVRGLLWRNRRHTNRKRPSARLARGFAPSWSFGSVTGRVSFVPNPERFTLLRLTAEVKGITRRLANEANRYGSGTGTVEVEGCVVPVRVEEQGRDETERKGEFYVLFVVDDPLAGETSKGNPPHGYPSGIPWGYFQPDVDDYEEEVYGKAKLCLLILGWCGMENNRGEQTLGLILAQDGDNGLEPVYRRVGIFVGGGGFGGYTMSQWAEFGERKRLLLI